MSNLRSISLFVFLGMLVVFSGCETKKPTREYNILSAQIAAITDELVRLDQELEAVRASSQQQQQEVQSSSLPRSLDEAGATGGLYRTPSGFQLPALSIQKALKNAGYYNGNLDGKIGSGTQQAIKAFQLDNGLEADGVVGRGTWAKLKPFLGTVK